MNFAPPLSNRQRASEDFRGLSEGMMRALSIIKQTKDEEEQKQRQGLQDQLTQQQIASNAIGLQQKQAEQGLVSQFGDKMTRDATPGALGPTLPGEDNALPTPFTNKSNSDAFKANIVKQLRVMRGQDPGDPLTESQARQAETDKIIGDAKAAPQLRTLNIQKGQADITASNAQATHATAAAAQAEAEAAKLKKETELLGTKGAKPLTADQTINNEGTLLQKYLAQAKDFVAVRDSYSRIKSTSKNPSPAGDLSMLYNYMKILDPNSTVREGEFATAQNSGSAFNVAGAMYNKILTGERLTEPQRADFLNQAKNLYESQKEIHKQTQKVFRGIATNDGLNPENVAPDLFLNEDTAPGSGGQVVKWGIDPKTGALGPIP